MDNDIMNYCENPSCLNKNCDGNHIFNPTEKQHDLVSKEFVIEFLKQLESDMLEQASDIARFHLGLIDEK